MLSHVSLGVRDLSASRSFYDAILQPLGYPRVAGTKRGEVAYGPAGAGLFWLYEIAEADKLASPGTHIAFRAPARDAVDEAARSARQLGSAFTREPGPHPDIAADYYGAVFFDPDGHKLEILVETAA